MPVTAEEKNAMARRFIRRVYKEAGVKADITAPALRTAAGDYVDLVIRGTTPATATVFKTWRNDALTGAFANVATAQQKNEMFAIAAEFDAGRVPVP